MSYFSNQGTQIHSGAAGYSRRRRRSARGFGAGMGGFGAGMGRSLMAYQDGSLGNGPREAFKDGSLGSGPPMAFHDGSLGMPLFLETRSGVQQIEEPMSIHHGPMGEYFTGMAGCRGCGGLGQDADAAVVPLPGSGGGATAPTIDLSDPEVVREVKNAIVSAPWMTDALQVPEYMADVENPVWTVKTAEMVGAWVSGYVEFLYAQPTPPPISKVQFVDTLVAESFVGSFYEPNALGLRNFYFGATLGATSVGINPSEAFPIMTKFLNDETASGSPGAVLPPVTEGIPSEKRNALTLGLGLAAVALVGVAVMAGGKRRRK